jgi:hypothetical protein
LAAQQILVLLVQVRVLVDQLFRRRGCVDGAGETLVLLTASVAKIVIRFDPGFGDFQR